MDVERIYLERLRSGSYRDFTKLYESYASRLYAFALHLTHSDALAKDIVQETFIKVWVRREQIDLDMSFSAFLFTMAKNQLLNEFRRQANSPLFLEDVVLNESGDGEETAIERKLSFEEFNHRLEIAKQKLTPTPTRSGGQAFNPYVVITSITNFVTPSYPSPGIRTIAFPGRVHPPPAMYV